MNSGIVVGDVLIFFLLYADDIILVADNEEDLQHMINKVDQFCQQSKMQVNVNKTHWMIFEQRSSKETCELKMTFANEELKRVENF